MPLEDSIKHWKTLPIKEKIRLEKVVASAVAREYEKALHEKINKFYNDPKNREVIQLEDEMVQAGDKIIPLKKLMDHYNKKDKDKKEDKDDGMGTGDIRSGFGFD